MKGLVVLVCLVLLGVVRCAYLPAARESFARKIWLKGSAVSDDTELGVVVALKQRNLDVIRDLVQKVSDPSSPEYGQYKNVYEIADIVAPPQEAIEKVTQWVGSIGARQVKTTKSRDFLTFVISAGDLQTHLSVQVHEFKHQGSSRVIHRTLDPVYIPEDVHEHIELLTGLTDFFDYNTERKVLKEKLTSTAKAASAAPAILSPVRGSESEITAKVKIYCQNGQPANSIPACSPVARLLEFEAVYEKDETVRHTLPIDNKHCVLDGGVVCSVHLDVIPYRKVNFTARVNFTDMYSPWGSYPTTFSPSPWVTPQMVYEKYEIPSGLRGIHPNNSQSVVAFEEQYISLDDLKNFFNFAGMPYQDPIIIGKNDPSNPGGESTLDIQWVMAIGAGIPSYFWSVSGPGPVHGGGAYILTWALEIADTVNPPLVTSISYGDTEQGFFQKFGNYTYIERMNTELLKMALRGLTVIAGSGDAGASNVGEPGNDISDTDPTCTPMRPFFPSNSPFVLSVSSTFFSVNSLPICQQQFEDHPLICSEVGEIAVSVRQGTHWTTGGGFSNFTTAPAWQHKTINNYLALAKGTLPPSQYWNAAGRGYPDVATVGFNLFVVWGGEIVSIGGTSASGPILAGIIAQINDLRLQQGKPPLGLINPSIYADPTTSLQNLLFRDIVVGENFDGDLQVRDSPYPTFCPYGFVTRVGWDPVTGLGTPHFRYLSDYLTSL